LRGAIVTRCTIAVDAMGGDRAPGEIVAGALRAAEELDVRVLLFGREEILEPLLPAAPPSGLEIVDARDVIEMGDDPITSVRRQKDSSLVRCAEAVRDGKADAMISAGNTGAAATAAVLRLGRLKGVAAPCIAVPIPVGLDEHPQVMVDAGAVVDPHPERLAQFALMGREFASVRYGVAEPRVGLLSNGEEPGKGDALRKAAFVLMQAVPGFVGNVEGRDFMHAGRVDVIVTDGFTGNIALKTMEGAMRALASTVFKVLDSTPEARAASETILPLLLEAAEIYDSETHGGAVLLGVKGLCVISHGSSSARAIVNAAKVSVECVENKLVERIREAVGSAG
jgi:glycerol-3-phosphate acyltransferase PlsX